MKQKKNSAVDSDYTICCGNVNMLCKKNPSRIGAGKIQKRFNQDV